MSGEQPDYEGIRRYDGTQDSGPQKWVQIDHNNALKVSRPFFNAHRHAQVRKGDILVTSTGYVSMGKVDIYDRDESAVVDGHVAIVPVDTDRYDPHFVAYFLRSHLGYLQFEKWFSGSSGQIEVQPGELGQFFVPKDGPDGIPLEEQQAIARAVTERLAAAQTLQMRLRTSESKRRRNSRRPLLNA